LQDLQAELLQKRELAKNLKRKLDGKEAEIGKIRSENEQNQKRIRAERQKLKGDHSATIEKYKKEEEERYKKIINKFDNFKLLQIKSTALGK
jgi:hypothetical protein